MSDDNAAEDSSAIPGLSNLRQWRLNMEGGPKEAPPPVDDRLDIVSADQSLADSSIGERLLRLRQWRQQIVDDVAPEPTVYDPEAAAAALAADTDGPIQGRVKGQRLHQNTHDDAEMPEELTDTANVSARPKTPDATGIQRLAMLAHSARQVLRLQREDALVIKDEADRRRLVPETVIVLGVSLGASAVWSVLRLLDLLTRPAPLGSQTVYINNSVTPDRSWLDFSNQMATIVLTLVPVVLALYLLATVRRPADGPLHVMGLSRTTVPKDIVLGMAMAAGVGIPGLGLYAVARALGMNVTIAAGNLAKVWWTIPVYILLAAMNGVLEEVVMVGYLFTRWTQRGLGPWKVIVISALIRGSYHLYQGFGGFIGNAIMGMIFGWIYMRTKRVLPLVIAHTILDVFSFVGYALLSPVWAWLK